MVAQAVSPALPILDDFCHGLLASLVACRTSKSAKQKEHFRAKIAKDAKEIQSQKRSTSLCDRWVKRANAPYLSRRSTIFQRSGRSQPKIQRF
ncbi:MAG TPA: hypothetical protein VNV86_05845 [Candidatus Acidoferrum sp.]|jgi:hypothetical protein|nr:hypothetical protein [Candidatus Acidoferrum sp.]